MLLRSSSTPVLGSLLSSFSDSPGHYSHHETAAPAAVTAAHKTALHNHHSFSFHPKGSLNFSTISCNSSPISPSMHDLGNAPNHHKGGASGFQRAQSEGNLEGLAYSIPPLSNNDDQFHTMSHAKKSSTRPQSMTLETIPSFSFYRYGHRCEDEDDENSDFDIDETEEYEDYDETSLVESRGKFRGSKSMSLIVEEEVSSDGGVNMIEKSSFEQNKERVTQEMYLAIEIGGGGDNWGGGGGSRGSSSSDNGADGDDNEGVEEYYKKMVEDGPNKSLFLRNYAQFLYQTQGDLERAEEYYARAILADPRDGEILSQYAKLVWELHRDQPRASTYFERAIQASPEDSHVQAAYASFLWEVDDDDQSEDEDENKDEVSLATYAMSPQFRGRATASVSA